MEYWNLYDYYGKKKKKISIRGSKLNKDDFHLVVNAWIVNDEGKYLITQRNANKSHPLMWECTGGSALLEETSKEAAIREVEEELGIDVSKSDAIFIGESRRYYQNCPDILHVWLFKSNEKIENIKIQEEEVNDVMWATKDQILELYKNNKFEANSFFDRVLGNKTHKLKELSPINNLDDIKKDIPTTNVRNDILPINITMIVGKNNNIIFPISVRLIDKSLGYIGEDFIYSQVLNDKIKNQINDYSNIIINELKKINYKGLLSIDYIIDNNDNIYLDNINTSFKSLFIIDKYLKKYCSITTSELHYLASNDRCIGNVYLNKIDNSFIDNIKGYENLKYYKVIKSNRVFNYSILRNGNFIMRSIDK